MTKLTEKYLDEAKEPTYVENQRVKMKDMNTFLDQKQKELKMAQKVDNDGKYLYILKDIIKHIKKTTDDWRM